MKKLMYTILFVVINFTTANAAPTTTDIPPGAYTLDKSHSTLTFNLSHLGFSRYTAQFKTFDAQLNLDPAHPEKSVLNVTIDASSLDLPTPPAGFKDELLGDKWLNSKANPQITFKSTKVVVTGDHQAEITGDLTLHGVTKPVTLYTKFNGGWKGLPNMDPHARAGFSAKTTFKRSDFGVAFGIPTPATNNMGVSDEVNVVIETEFSGPALAKSKPAK